MGRCVIGRGMRIFVQNKRTKMFLADNASWVSEHGQALDFKKIYLAMDFCAAKHISEEVVLVLLLKHISDPVIVRPTEPAPLTSITKRSSKSAPRSGTTPIIAKKDSPQVLRISSERQKWCRKARFSGQYHTSMLPIQNPLN